MITQLRALGCSSAAAAAIFDAYPGSSLQSATAVELRQHGATRAAAARIVAAYHLTSSTARDASAPVAGSPDAVVRAIREIYTIDALDQEHMIAVFLDSRQRVIDLVTISIGTLGRVDVHPRDIFRPALRLSAAAIVLAHNHPSGDATPSSSDIELTVRMIAGGELLGVPVVDHLILARGGDTTSLASLGLMG